MRIPRPSARTLAQAAGAAGAAFFLLSIIPSSAQAIPLPGLPGLGIPGLDKLNPFEDLQNWGLKKAGELLLSLFGALVDLLLPDEIGKQGAALIQWIGSGPDFALAIKTVPSLRTLLGYSLWLGFSILPATLAYAGIRSMLGDGPPITELAGRLLGALLVLALWPYMWQLLPLLTSNITAVYLKNTAVVAGLNKYVELLVAGTAVTAALGALTWPLLTIVVMGVGGFFFVSLLVFKAGLWIVGAAVYMGGPILVGFVLTDRGMQMIRSVSAVVVAVFALPIVWSMILAVTAITVGAGGAMTKVLGGAGIGGQIFGALMVGAVAIMGPAMCFALGKAILGGVAGSVLTTARSVTSRGGGSPGVAKAGSAAPKSAGAGASTVSAVRGNMTRGWNRGLGGVGPQPAGTGRMAMHTAKSGGLAGAGGTVAGAIWRSQGSSLKKTMAGAQTARAAAGQKIGRTTTAAAVGAQNLAAKAVPGMKPMTAGAGAPTHAMGAVPPQPKPPRERATRRGREDQVSTANAESAPPSRNGNGSAASPGSRNGNGDGSSSTPAATPSTGSDRPSTSAARSARANGASGAASTAAASSNGGGEGGTPAAKASGSRPRRDRGSSSPTPTPSPSPAPSPAAAAQAPAPSQPRPSRGPRREASSRPAPDLADRPNTTSARSADDQEEQS